MPDRVPEDMPAEDMPGRMPEDRPDRMPEDMPDKKTKMPEGMSDRMPRFASNKTYKCHGGDNSKFFFCRYFSPAGGHYLRCVVVVLVDYAWLQWMEVGLEYFGITFCVVT